MRIGETELEMVERHVKGGKIIVEKQRLLISTMRQEHLYYGVAESLLRSFEQAQELHEEHLVRLKQRNFLSKA